MSASLDMDHPGEAHAWVELSNGYLWTLADPVWGSGGMQILQFGRNDGRHLRYGCADLEGDIYQELRIWATQHAPLVAKRFAALKYVLSAEPQNMRLTSNVAIQKGWDGRWLNALVLLVITTVVLCRLRDCCILRRIRDENTN